MHRFRSLAGRAAFAAAAALTTAAVATTAASALTVAPAGTWPATASGVALRAGNAPLSCASSTLSGTLTAAGAGAVTAVTVTGCPGFTITATVPWSAAIAPTTGGVTTTFGTVGFTATGTGCTFRVAGTLTATNLGPSPVALSTLALTPAGSSLTVTSVTGCFGLVNPGAAASVSGTYTLRAPQSVWYP